ncbi:hypothetical protein DFH06DRAFT_1353016 [Mycena polygramma]|nr:hypothetical protein DFH06DRAFT_1353016 [Mycena polygramma]
MNSSSLNPFSGQSAQDVPCLIRLLAVHAISHVLWAHHSFPVERFDDLLFLSFASTHHTQYTTSPVPPLPRAKAPVCLADLRPAPPHTQVYHYAEKTPSPHLPREPPPPFLLPRSKPALSATEPNVLHHLRDKNQHISSAHSDTSRPPATPSQRLPSVTDIDLLHLATPSQRLLSLNEVDPSYYSYAQHHTRSEPIAPTCPPSLSALGSTKRASTPPCTDKPAWAEAPQARLGFMCLHPGCMRPGELLPVCFTTCSPI